MVKPGPVSKKKEVIFEILNLLSQRAYGFRELHRSLPKEHRAGSFTTLHDCINLLKSQGFVDTDQKTKKIRLTSEGDLERKKQIVITDINEARMIAGRTSSSDTNPICYEWSLARNFTDAKQNFSFLHEMIRVDPYETNLTFLSYFLLKILQNSDNEEPANQKKTLDYFRHKLQNKLPPDAEILNIFSVDIRRFLTWLETPIGGATLEYAIEQKGEDRIEKIARLTHRSFSPQTPTTPPCGYGIAQGKKEEPENAENGVKRLKTHRKRTENARRTHGERQI